LDPGLCQFIGYCAIEFVGWDGVIPECGVSGYWISGCDSGCSPIVETRVQECQ
jgi:hypothetical protein